MDAIVFLSVIVIFACFGVVNYRSTINNAADLVEGIKRAL